MKRAFGGKTISRQALLLIPAIFVMLSNAQAEVPAFMQKPTSDHVRLMCYNINWDSIFENGDPDNHPYREYDRSDEFVRLVTAINPDIVCLQEINYDRNAQDVGDILDAAIPIGGGQNWRTYIGSDCVIASKYNLSLQADDTYPSTNRGQAMALVDLPDSEFTTDLYIINSHFKCCSGSSNVARREQNADAIINWIRDIRNTGGNITLPTNTPVVVLGDLNVIDDQPTYITTLLTGDITDEGTYGADLSPDWDNTDNTDLLPLHNGIGPDNYTWRDDSGGYDPDALDRIIVTDSVIAIDNSFVLDTTSMSSAELSACGLQAYDVMLDPGSGTYDHLPLVIDIAPNAGCHNDSDCDDGVFCNGSEYCDGNGDCQAGTNPCPDSLCREGDDTCVECLSDANCDDDLFCNGAETCDLTGTCQTGSDPCPDSLCDEDSDSCVECFDNSDCDDANPCNGLETCDIYGVCQPGFCGYYSVLIDESFDSGAGDFNYEDDVFSTNHPDMVDGTYTSTGGKTGGGVRVYIGASWTGQPCSGGWKNTINIAQNSTIEVTLNYRLRLGAGYETSEYGEAVLTVDNIRYGDDTNSSLIHTQGNGNGGSTYDSGWLAAQYDIPLAAGTHEIIIGAYNNNSSVSDEWTEVTFDNLTVTALIPEDCQCADELFCNGEETCIDEACQPGSNPCPGSFCREDLDACVDCLIDNDCDDNLFCNGIETCDGSGNCQAGTYACPGSWCDEDAAACRQFGNGDFDGDFDVDLNDFAAFQRCFGLAATVECYPGNLVGEDAVIDGADFAEFVALMAGP